MVFGCCADSAASTPLISQTNFPSPHEEREAGASFSDFKLRLLTRSKSDLAAPFFIFITLRTASSRLCKLADPDLIVDPVLEIAS